MEDTQWFEIARHTTLFRFFFVTLRAEKLKYKYKYKI